jgi:hypothetical protein
VVFGDSRLVSGEVASKLHSALPISEEDLEDYILANAPSFVRARNDADRDFADHRTRSLRDSLADIGEDLPAGHAPARRRQRPTPTELHVPMHASWWL